MPPSRFQRVRAQGVTFVFKFDPDAPDLLHIFARHLKTPRDAIRVWFEGAHSYNAERRRFEAYDKGVGLFWYPINLADNVMMVVSCFDLNPE